MLPSGVNTTKKTTKLTLDELSDWAKQNGEGTFTYDTAEQPEAFFRCALTLRFTRLFVDEFSRIVSFTDNTGNCMTLIGVIAASLDECGGNSILTVQCRRDPLLGNRDIYVFKKLS